MKIKEWNFQSFDGLDMYGREWLPDGDMKGVIALVHGLGEHCSRYDHLGAWLTEHGYGLVSFDLRGHGRSGGGRGHSPSPEAFRKDIDEVLQRVRGTLPGGRMFLYGHSLGGILVLDYVLDRKPALNGVIVTGPGLHTSLEQQKGKVLLAKLLGSLAPVSALPSGLDASQISRDAEVVQKYREDPLVHDRITFGMAKGLLVTIPKIFERLGDFPLPLLLMHGTADQIAFPSGSEEVARRVKGECTLKLWENLLHEVHNEPEKEQVFEYLLAWLEKHS